MSEEEIQVTVIRPLPKWKLLDLKELRRYRDLFYFLVARDIKVRYKQTVLGGLWAVLQPFMLMVVFSLFFGQLAKMPSDGVPYPIFAYAALVPWTYFANAMSGAALSLVSNQAFITKVYFPRIAIPSAVILGWLLDFFIALSIVFVMMAVFGIAPNLGILMLPLLIIVMIMTAAGAGMLLSSLAVYFRDFKYIIPFLVQFWMFLSPVAYPMSLVPEGLRWLYALNPMAGVIEGFRSALLGSTAFPWPEVAISAAVAVLLFIAGLWYFKRTERVFADVA